MIAVKTDRTVHLQEQVWAARIGISPVYGKIRLALHYCMAGESSSIEGQWSDYFTPCNFTQGAPYVLVPLVMEGLQRNTQNVLHPLISGKMGRLTTLCAPYTLSP